MRRLQPGRIVQQDDGSLLAPDFGDTYASRAGALAQSRAVFLAGCGLPERLTGRVHTVLETGFGTGLNALAMAQLAHRQHVMAQDGQGARSEGQQDLLPEGGSALPPHAPDPACHIHYVGIEGHPLSREDLVAALAPYDELAPWRDALIAGWPPLMEGVYRWSLGPRFTLTLAFGEALPTLRELEVAADSVFLDGFAPDRNPAMWAPQLFAEVVAHCRPSARLASWCVAGEVRRSLAAAGCRVERKPGFAGKRERLEGVVSGGNQWPITHPAAGNDQPKLLAPAGVMFGGGSGWQRAGPTDGGASLQMAPQSASKARRKVPWAALPASDGLRGTTGHPEAPATSHSATPERALVIGAGIAGASVAAALAARGIVVTVIDTVGPAAGASGNPVGVVRPEPSGLDHPISLLTALGTLWLKRWLEARGVAAPVLHADRCGALRLPRDDKHARRLREHADASPAEWMRWMTTEEAAVVTGQSVAGDGVWIGDAFNLVPPDLVAALLATPGIRVVSGAVEGIEAAENRPLTTDEGVTASTPTAACPEDNTPADDADAIGIIVSKHPPELVWRVTLDDGTSSDWPLVVVANAFGVSGHLRLPCRHVRGQLSWSEAKPGQPLSAIVCREGYVTPAVDGRHIVGATFQRDDADLTPRPEDDETNRWRLARLLPGWEARALHAARVSVRAATPDRLPLVGALAPGLYASLGHGSRGLTCAPLCGELLASMACGEPLPLPRDLVRRLDPLRFGDVAAGGVGVGEIKAKSTNVREEQD